MKTNQTAKNRRLLIVDDNPAIHDDYRKILASGGVSPELDALEAAVFGETADREAADPFELTSALQGKEALKLVTESVVSATDFAVAFVDMRMPPGWDGLETIERLWEVDPKLQVVICTAYSDYSWDEIVGRVGHGDKLLILKKPFDPIEVRQLANTLTAKWDLERTVHAKMVSIVETAADGIISMRGDGIIESCNAAARALFALTEEQVHGADFASLVSESDEAEIRGLLEAESAGVHRAIEVKGVQGEEEFPMLVSLSLYETPAGRRCTAILRDLSDYKLLQERLARAQRLEAVGQLAAGVAHEINTPLQYSLQNLSYLDDAIEKLVNSLDTLESSLDMAGEARSWQERSDSYIEVTEANKLTSIRSEIPEAIGDTVDGLQCVSRIVRAMRELTHPGGEAEEPVVADLNEIARSAIKLSRNHWKEFATVETEFFDGESSIRCHPQDIGRVVINLITNAADAIAENADPAAQPGGKITLRTRPAEDGMELTVEDNGPGILPEVAERVFDPFFTTKQLGKGTGQGLSISHEIVVKRHRGELTFKSESGEGATFSVRLPRDPKPPTDDSVPASHKATAELA